MTYMCIENVDVPAWDDRQSRRDRDRVYNRYDEDEHGVCNIISTGCARKLRYVNIACGLLGGLTFYCPSACIITSSKFLCRNMTQRLRSMHEAIVCDR